MLTNYKIKHIHGQTVYLYKLGNKNPMWTYTFRDRFTGEVMAASNFKNDWVALNHAGARIAVINANRG